MTKTRQYLIKMGRGTVATEKGERLDLSIYFYPRGHSGIMNGSGHLMINDDLELM
jgi:hypothetical protein